MMRSWRRALEPTSRRATCRPRVRVTHQSPSALFETLLQASVTFAWAWMLAMAFRRTTPLHARFMIATGLVLLDPVGGRLLYYYGPPLANPVHTQILTFGLADLILLGLLWRPRMAERPRRIFAAGAALFPLVHAGWFTLAPKPAFTRFATWFRDLPLT